MSVEDGPKMPESPDKKKQDFHSWHGQLVGTYMRPWFDSGIFEFANKSKVGPLASQYPTREANMVTRIPTYEQHVRETYTPEQAELILKGTPKSAMEEFDKNVREFNDVILPAIQAGEERHLEGFLAHVENLFRQHWD